ncbi:chemoreceptor glutamine deamidase CheD [Lachnospiraceae bacterium]|nr:chemoreceptor glutamine deamidase CheD [Lachnospiraceae bacterium]
MATFTISELESMIVVNMGDYKTARGEKKLMTKDLGSCIGVALRDPHTGVGGLLHVMLPYHSTTNKEHFVAAKYADTGLDEMISSLVQQGAKRNHLVAKIAGGAHMIRCEQIPESSDISSRNVNAVKQKLAELQIPLLASDVGEYFPRTVVFEPGSGTFRILTPGKAERTI